MKWCLYANRCSWGHIYEPNCCALENESCKMDDEAWEMLDLDADLQNNEKFIIKRGKRNEKI